MDRRAASALGTAIVAAVVLMALVACGDGGSAPLPTNVPPVTSPSGSPRPAASPAGSPAAVPQAASPTPPPTATPTPTSTPAPSPTPTPTPAPPPTPTPAPTSTPAPPPTPTPKIFAVVVDPAAPRTSQDILITVMGLNANDTFTIEVTPSGSTPYPQTYQADARGEWRTVTPANSWTGRSSFEVKATRTSTGQVIQRTYPLSP